MRSRANHNQKQRRREKNVQVKIGHGGTLDPLATGVLIAGVGKGTKSLQDFLLCTKIYDAVVLFGTSTDTYDRVGKVLRRAPYEHITKEMVEEHLGQFRGKFDQLPPLYSALKMNGKPLYEYAREGKEIPREIERRPVEVLNLELVEWMEGGTHSHEAPTDEAGHAEVNVANTFWKAEKTLPPSKKNTKPVKEATQSPKVETQEKPDILSAVLEQTKRKMTENEDDLVLERPASKREKAFTTTEDATMSGGLTEPLASLSTSAEDSEAPVTEKSPVKGPPAARIRMTVTSGFYVRSLCHDLGASLGSAGLMAELERTRQGEFTLGENVLEWSDLSKGEEVWGPKVRGWLDEWNEGKRGSKPDHTETGQSSKSAVPTEVKSEPVAEAGESSTNTATEVKPEAAVEPAQVNEPVAETVKIKEEVAEDAATKREEVKDENKEALGV